MNVVLTRAGNSILIRRWLIDASKRLVRSVLWRLAKDVELMQVVSAGLSTAAFATQKLSGITAIRNRDSLLIDALKTAPDDGLICEFGVYRGHTLRVIADALKHSPIYGFDSFEGLPEAWRMGFDKGTFNVDLSDIPIFPENVKLYPGLFGVTLPLMLREDARRAAFLHIDCDLYSSTKCIFDSMSGRLKVGTVIVFDEYFNFPGWENDEHRALVEAARDFGFTYDYLFYNPNGQQVAVVITGVLAP